MSCGRQRADGLQGLPQVTAPLQQTFRKGDQAVAFAISPFGMHLTGRHQAAGAIFQIDPPAIRDTIY
jgi:hypothetical protein